jgi:hypothetical protein
MAAPHEINGDDSELGHVRDGYPALATWIGGDPDGETLVFRRFRRLSARNLLHLQSQLIQLEQEIDGLDMQARTSADLDARQASRRWETFTKLAKLAADPDRPERVHMEKVSELSAKMKKYGNIFTLIVHLSKLISSSRRSITTTISDRQFKRA